ncbi:MAG: hypothetical protein RLZZ265_1259 [Verrucomicrobiota bacterium]|jgi:hypothetical protein
MHHNRHEVFFHCDGIVEISLPVQKLLKANLEVIHDFSLRFQFGSKHNEVPFAIAHHGHRTLAKCVDEDAVTGP